MRRWRELTDFERDRLYRLLRIKRTFGWRGRLDHAPYAYDADSIIGMTITWRTGWPSQS